MPYICIEFPVPDMLKSCVPYLGSPDCIENDESKSKELELGPSNSHGSFQSKHIVVRVVHAGGKIDKYPNAVLAAKLLENLPGNWLARPEVFKHPHESLICPEEYLLPGHKYYVIPLSTVHKLKRKHNKMRMKRQGSQETNSDVLTTPTATDQSEDEEYSIFTSDGEQSFCYARDFYESKEMCTSNMCVDGSSRVSKSNRNLLPLSKPKPKPKPKACNSVNTWEPGLTSIQEVSP